MMTVVGVVGDVRANGVQEEPALDVYAPHMQAFAGDSFFVMRTAVDPITVTAEIPRALAAVDPQQSYFDTVTMADRVAASMWQQRVSGAVLTAFAFVAFVLSVIGVHAVTSYAVAMRRAELGVRMALGAEPGTIVANTVAEALRPAWFGAAAGTIAGMGAALIVARLLPVSFGPAGALITVILSVLLVVAASAAAIPAVRTIRCTTLPAVLR
jgi:putative ABC transport system permease protein